MIEVNCSWNSGTILRLQTPQIYLESHTYSGFFDHSGCYQRATRGDEAQHAAAEAGQRGGYGSMACAAKGQGSSNSIPNR